MKPLAFVPLSFAAAPSGDAALKEIVAARARVLCLLAGYTISISGVFLGAYLARNVVLNFRAAQRRSLPF